MRRSEAARHPREVNDAIKEMPKVKPSRQSNRSPRSFAAALALAVGSILALAAPALAAPELGVQIERDEAAVSHSDERIDYTVDVQNLAPPLPSLAASRPEVGERLRCQNPSWSQESSVNYSFEFQWVRNGVRLESAEDLANGAKTQFYTVQAADEGKALQCLVKGTNGAKTGTYLVASQPVAVVDPQPAVAPPAPNNTTSPARRPAIAGPLKSGTATAGEWKAGEELSCTAPTAGWSASHEASPISWNFEWLRDGQTAPGSVTNPTSTTSKYTLTAADVNAPVAPAVFQCVAKATNAGGAALVESLSVKTSAPAPAFGLAGETSAPVLNAAFTPSPERGGNTLSGTVTLEVELPGGTQTVAFDTVGSGWGACAKVPATASQNARVTCTRSDALAPGEAYPQLSIVTALGADAPDLAVATATVYGGGAASAASDEDQVALDPFREFGLIPGGLEARFLDEAAGDYTQAGGHPFSGVLRTTFTRKRILQPVNTEPASRIEPIGHVKTGIGDIPRGVVGNALAVPELCQEASEVLADSCPAGSRVGGVRLEISQFPPPGVNLIVYALKPEYGTPAQFAFHDPTGNLFTISARLRPDEGYAVSFELSPSPTIPILEAEFTFCDFGAKVFGPSFVACKKHGEADANPKPLFSLPTRCGKPAPVTKVRINSWERPEEFKEYTYTNELITGCEKVPFTPEMEKLDPSTGQADSPTGLEVELTMPTDGLEDPEGISQANLREVEVVFPEGMAINASAGHGLGSCSAEQIKLRTNEPVECPDSSKIGTMEVETPIIEDDLTGEVYIARQGEVKGALTGFYIVFDSPENGILIKIPAKVQPDPVSGQLTATIEESPEAPFSKATLHFPAGPRSVLLTPPACGTYEITSKLTPWSGNDPVVQTTSFEVTEGPGGGPCPNGALAPHLQAGSAVPAAGKASPFSFRLFRADGTQRFAGLSMRAPKGLTAYLAGVSICPQQAINAISQAPLTGVQQIARPSCPPNSLIGTALAGAGAGPDPFYVKTGRVYLTGPYKGAPASITVVAPAVAGPLDLGSVVIQNAVYIDPETAQLTVHSDPIPTIIHGVLPGIRDIRVNIDRPHFTLNPTDCEPKQIDVRVWGEKGGVADVSNPFRVGGCRELDFKPKIHTRLFGPTGRGGHPKLRGVLQSNGSSANIRRAVVTIPRSEFLDQAHIRTICTRVQFAAKACPKGAVYGHVRAFTPLLDYPIEGPVYLRSSDHELPDLVATVRGPAHQPIEAAVVGRIDSIKGQIRASFEDIPDVPLDKVILTMRGAKKGLLINSRNVCARTYRANVGLAGHNGARTRSRPPISNRRCAKAKTRKNVKRKVQRHRSATGQTTKHTPKRG